MAVCGLRLFGGKSAGGRKQEKQPLGADKTAVTDSDPWLLQAVNLPDCTSLALKCIDELKSRALHVDHLLSPFRAGADPRAARSLLSRVFSRCSTVAHQIVQLDALALDRELHISDPHALAGLLRWILSRIPNGVIDIQRYRIWQRFEADCADSGDMFSDAWHLLIGDEDRSFIFDSFLSLLCSVCAHARHNGHDVEELIRASSLWLFPNQPSTVGAGFMVGYQTYASQSQAMMHIFLGSLRQDKMRSTMPLARALEKMLEATTYPPEGPVLRETTKLVLSSTVISKSPLALLRRAAQHKSSSSSVATSSAILETFVDDPASGFNLADSSLRVLATMQSMLNSRERVDVPNWHEDKDAWVQFRDLGFSNKMPRADVAGGALASKDILKHWSADAERPRTLDWGQFMQAGFRADDARNVSSEFLPPELRIQTDLPSGDLQQKAEREKTTVKTIDLRVLELDCSLEAAWENSLAYETSQALKGFFGRSVVLRLRGHDNAWLVCEEVMPNQSGAGLRSPSSPIAALPLVGADTEWLVAAEKRLHVLSQLRRTSKVTNVEVRPLRSELDSDFVSHRHTPTVSSMPSVHTEIKTAAAWVDKYEKGKQLEKHLVESDGAQGQLCDPVALQAPTLVNGVVRVTSRQAALDEASQQPTTAKATDVEAPAKTAQSASTEPTAPAQPQAVARKPSLISRMGSIVRKTSAANMQNPQTKPYKPARKPVHTSTQVADEKPKFHAPRHASKRATALQAVPKNGKPPPRPARGSYHSAITDVSEEQPTQQQQQAAAAARRHAPQLPHNAYAPTAISDEMRAQTQRRSRARSLSLSPVKRYSGQLDSPTLDAVAEAGRGAGASPIGAQEGGVVASNGNGYNATIRAELLAEDAAAAALTTDRWGRIRQQVIDQTSKDLLNHQPRAMTAVGQPQPQLNRAKLAKYY